jgi:carbon monoxide dehydrogenase subunit G
MEVSMNEFDIVTVIDRPPDQVFAFLVDVDKVADWNPQVIEVRKTSEGPLGVGTTLLFVGKFLGRRFESVSQWTEYIPNERFSTKTTSGPFHLEIENTLSAVDSGTRLATTYRGESQGFIKLAEPVIVRLTKKQFETATENLKALLEAEGS